MHDHYDIMKHAPTSGIIKPTQTTRRLLEFDYQPGPFLDMDPGQTLY